MSKPTGSKPRAQQRPPAAKNGPQKPGTRPPKPRPPQATAAPSAAEAAADTTVVSGRNAVLETLRAASPVNRVWLAEGVDNGFAGEVMRHCREQGIPYQFVPRVKLQKIAGSDNRGAALELASCQYVEVDDILQKAAAAQEQPLILLLDGIEDPHNLGAVIRTALCVGAHGLIIPKRRAAAITPTVIKTSAGATAYMPVARVSNLVQTATALKKQGIFLAAADMDGQTAWQANFDLPLALVLGGEGQGVSPLLKSTCDFVVSLPLKGAVASLNVSAAAAALLYEICRQRSQG